MKGVRCGIAQTEVPQILEIVCPPGLLRSGDGECGFSYQ